MKTIDAYLDRYNAIQDAISDSKLYQQALDAFKHGLQDFSFTPQEQANAYATFLAQTALGLQAQSMDMALKIELTEIQANDLRRKSAIEAEITKSQAMSASISVDTAQAGLEGAKSNALQEKIKCMVLIKSANDNTEINKCNALVEYMNIIGNATNYGNITSANLHQSIKDSIERIGKDGSLTQLNTEENSWISKQVPRVILYASKTNLSVQEVGIFGVIHNIDGGVIEWDFAGQKYSGSEIMDFAFDTAGYQEVKVAVKSGEESHSETLRVCVNEVV